jgi:hypothetical protein
LVSTKRQALLPVVQKPGCAFVNAELAALLERIDDPRLSVSRTLLLQAIKLLRADLENRVSEKPGSPGNAPKDHIENA